jgi:hypothetical protein
MYNSERKIYGQTRSNTGNRSRSVRSLERNTGFAQGFHTPAAVAVVVDRPAILQVLLDIPTGAGVEARVHRVWLCESRNRKSGRCYTVQA